MNAQELNKWLDAYYDSVKFAISLNNINIRTRSYNTQLKRYIANRNKQLGTFLEDGKMIFNLEGKEDLTVKNPRMKKGCMQYHYLEKPDLAAYIGFRTAVRKQQKPKNPQPTFLSIYLMEIVNDFYSSKLDDKVKLVKSVEKLFPKGAKFKKLIIEAYEILFFQSLELNSVEEFKNKYKIKEMFISYSEDESIFNKRQYIFDKSTKELSLSRVDRYLLENSYEEVLDKAIEANYIATLSVSRKPIENIIDLTYSKFASFAINKLYTRFPIQISKKLYDDKGGIIIVSEGYLVVLRNPEYYALGFANFLNLVRKKFRKILNNEEYVDDDETFYYYQPNFQDKQKEEIKIEKIVQEWINKNSYCDNAYEHPIEYMEHIKQRESFTIDVEEVDKVRNKSAKIQEKLIIEDEYYNETSNNEAPKGKKAKNTNSNPVSYFEKLKTNKNNDLSSNSNSATSGKNSQNRVGKTNISGKTSNKKQNKYVKMVNSFTELEHLVFTQLVFGTIDKANEIAKSNNTMLSLLIDSINIKATDHIDDIVIEDFAIIEDYKEEIVQSFS